MLVFAWAEVVFDQIKYAISLKFMAVELASVT